VSVELPRVTRQVAILLLVGASAVVAGCGSSVSTPNASVASQPQTTQAATTATTTTASIGPPDFVVNGITSEGDKVKVEGRLGRPLPAGESEVQQDALAGCPEPSGDGRAVIVRLDLSATLESSLSGEVKLTTGWGKGTQAHFLLGSGEGAQCESGQPVTYLDLGTLQPGQTAHQTIWLVLADAITPDNPHPTEGSLAAQDWSIEAPFPEVNGTPAELVHSGHVHESKIEGSRIGFCEGSGFVFVSVVAGTPAEQICGT
jgi:hypothetical protein